MVWKMGIKADGKITASFSEIQTFLTCPFKHKLQYLDKLEKNQDSPIMAYGRAIHYGMQKLWEVPPEIAQKLYVEQLHEEYKHFNDEHFTNDLAPYHPDVAKDKGMWLIYEMYKSGYPNIHCVSIEEDFEECLFNNFYLKGRIDIVLMMEDVDNPENSRIKICDFKTTEKGWEWYKKNDFITHMQLYLYKYFYHQKHNFPLDRIDLEFILLNGVKKTVEIFPLEDNMQNVKQAYDVALMVMRSIYSKGDCRKNLKGCKFCQFQSRPEICDQKTNLLETPVKFKNKRQYWKKATTEI
jgi:hypothetical protein